ncbi:hypothetical protein ACWD4F_27695 [Streptomyces aureus]
MPKPIPKDLPDQQAAPDEDLLDVDEPGQPTGRDRVRRAAGSEAEDSEEQEAGTDVPDTDEAGSGRRGAPHGSAPSEQPVPDEPTD